MASQDRQARIERRDTADSTLSTLTAEPTENMLAMDPAEPTDRTDPAQPMDRIDPADPMDRIDPVDPIDKTESPRDPRAAVICLCSHQPPPQAGALARADRLSSGQVSTWPVSSAASARPAQQRPGGEGSS